MNSISTQINRPSQTEVLQADREAGCVLSSDGQPHRQCAPSLQARRRPAPACEHRNAKGALQGQKQRRLESFRRGRTGQGCGIRHGSPHTTGRQAAAERENRRWDFQKQRREIVTDACTSGDMHWGCAAQRAGGRAARVRAAVGPAAPCRAEPCCICRRRRTATRLLVQPGKPGTGERASGLDGRPHEIGGHVCCARWGARGPQRRRHVCRGWGQVRLRRRSMHSRQVRSWQSGWH